MTLYPGQPCERCCAMGGDQSRVAQLIAMNGIVSAWLCHSCVREFQMLILAPDGPFVKRETIEARIRATIHAGDPDRAGEETMNAAIVRRACLEAINAFMGRCLMD